METITTHPNNIFRCEVRPGPEFLLRRYTFDHESDNNTSFSFTLVQFHYSDRDCRRPLFGVTAGGTVRPVKPSWLVPGATEAEVELRESRVLPFTSVAAKQLQQRLVGVETFLLSLVGEMIT